MPCSYNIPVLYGLELSEGCMHHSDADHLTNLVITDQLVGRVLD